MDRTTQHCKPCLFCSPKGNASPAAAILSKQHKWCTIKDRRIHHPAQRYGSSGKSSLLIGDAATALTSPPAPKRLFSEPTPRNRMERSSSRYGAGTACSTEESKWKRARVWRKLE